MEIRIPDEKRDISIMDMDLSVRSYNCLKRRGINYLSDLEKMTYNDMLKVRNLGRKSLDEVIHKMKEYGAELRKDETDG